MTVSDTHTHTPYCVPTPHTRHTRYLHLLVSALSHLVPLCWAGSVCRRKGGTWGTLQDLGHVKRRRPGGRKYPRYRTDATQDPRYPQSSAVHPCTSLSLLLPRYLLRTSHAGDSSTLSVAGQSLSVQGKGPQRTSPMGEEKENE